MNWVREETIEVASKKNLVNWLYFARRKKRWRNEQNRNSQRQWNLWEHYQCCRSWTVTWGCVPGRSLWVWPAPTAESQCIRSLLWMPSTGLGEPQAAHTKSHWTRKCIYSDSDTLPTASKFLPATTMKFAILLTRSEHVATYQPRTENNCLNHIMCIRFGSGCTGIWAWTKDKDSQMYPPNQLCYHQKLANGHYLRKLR